MTGIRDISIFPEELFLIKTTFLKVISNTIYVPLLPKTGLNLLNNYIKSNLTA